MVSVTAVVALETKIGPVVVVFWPGRGLHALDVVLLVATIPLATVLLRYAERCREDETPRGRF